MYVEPKMFVIEVFVLNDKFRNVFALDSNDQKQIGLNTPNFLPLPPEPLEKMDKKRTKQEQAKKRKRLKVPHEQAGQKILFTSIPKGELQNMNARPMLFSMSKKECMASICHATISWYTSYIGFLQSNYKCKDLADYNNIALFYKELDRKKYLSVTWLNKKYTKIVKKDVEANIFIGTKVNLAKEGQRKNVDIVNLREPCDQPVCSTSKHLWTYIRELVDKEKEDDDLKEIVSICKRKKCSVLNKIKPEIELKVPRIMPELLTQYESKSDCSAKHAECTSSDKTCNEYGCDLNKKIHRQEPSAILQNSRNQRDTKYLMQLQYPPVKKVYAVYYFTVEYNFDQNNDNSSSASSAGSKNPSKQSSDPGPVSNSTSPRVTKTATPNKNTLSPGTSSYSSVKQPSEPKAVKINPQPENAEPFKFCSKDCPTANEHIDTIKCSKNVCSSEMKKRNLCTLSIEKLKDPCIDPVCLARNRSPPSPDDSDVVIRLDDIHPACCIESCNVTDNIKFMIAEGIKKQKIRKGLCRLGVDASFDAQCYCDCECKFNFSSRTTYCPVCGGYECLGDDMMNEPEFRKPHPCPVYNNLYDKNHFEGKQPQADTPHTKTAKSKQSTKSDAISINSRKNFTSEKKTAKSPETTKAPAKKEVSQITTKGQKSAVKKKEKVEIKEGPTPQEAPTPKPKSNNRALVPVPKHMGWLWTSEDVPGMKPRPKWRPGAANKILVRRYRSVREGIESILKKKRALLNKRKKLEMKPTVVVKKTDGEYTVQMEVFKKYSKERLLYQYPYDDKPPITYTVGKTPEEKTKIQKYRERKERRENRRKCKVLQSTFRDKCQEICLKAYNAAIGLLPVPYPNAPNCPCYTDALPPVSPPIDSCSCSEECSISTDDTDGDDWIIEFTPPSARWDPQTKNLPSYTNNESQYSYLDYRVKVLDKSGNQVPRYFKGPDGKQECSDLGGFWGPGHVWLEINKDGFIGPDNRWAPSNFTGPDGNWYSAENGAFTDMSGKTFQIGIDGYIDQNNKWVHYPQSMKPKPLSDKSKKNQKQQKTDKQQSKTVKQQSKTDKQQSKTEKKQKLSPGRGPSIDKSPGRKEKSPIQIKKNAAESLTPKKNVTQISSKAKSPLIMSTSVNLDRRSPINFGNYTSYVPNTNKLKKEEAVKLARFGEILKSLEIYEEFGDLCKGLKTNRASNTAKKPNNSNVYGYNRRQSKIDKPLFLMHKNVASYDQSISSIGR